MNKHTDTPWEDNKMGLITDTEGHKIASMYMHMIYRDSDALMKANAAYIVKAVNSHEALVEALKLSRKHIGHLLQNPDKFKKTGETHAILEAIRAALKLAGEE